MADDTDNTQAIIDALSKYGIGAGATGAANEAQLAAYDAVLKNLQGELGDYSKLGPAGYKSITPQTLGPSALAGIQPDAQAREDQQAAIAQLGDIANSGGLELSDRNALNQVEQKLGRSNAARQNSLRNQFAARGQLGSGAELAMDLANNQNAAMNANETGENIAAQAQKRAMQAILDKGAAARSMSNDDYMRKQKAAEAADAIARANAAMSTDASKYNNNILGQAYDDQLRKLQGETGLTNSLNTALLGKGGQQAAGIVSQGNNLNGLIGAIPKGGGNGNPGNGSTTTQDGNTTTVTNSDGSSTTGTVTDNPDPSSGDDDIWASLSDDGSLA